MIQHQFEQFSNDLGKISNTISFHESITQHLSTVAIKLSELEKILIFGSKQNPRKNL